MSMKNNKSVENYISNNPEWKETLMVLKGLIDTTILHENIKWGIPVYTLNNKNIVGFCAFKAYVGLWFYQGALIKDSSKKLINAQEGKTKALRQWRFSSTQEMVLEKENILTYIHEAIQNHKQGKSIKPQKKSALKLAEELSDQIEKDLALKKALDGFSESKKREFSDYNNEAKRVSTKQNRLTKIIPMILKGEGLNDKYRK
jgi:uncharacterized protein YdeI (YjbR/CyaY-like superfamily)